MKLIQNGVINNVKIGTTLIDIHIIDFNYYIVNIRYRLKMKESNLLFIDAIQKIISFTCIKL